MTSSSTTTQKHHLVITQIVVVATSLVIGYKLGVKSTLPITRSLSTSDDVPELAELDFKAGEKQDTIDNGSDSEDEDEDVADGDLAAVKASFAEQCKLVLLVRTDLKMTSGKIAAQCGHATLACYKALAAKNPSLVRHWERTGQAKIALRVKSEEEMLELEAIAKSLNLCARAIHDQGRTQVAEGSRTVLGIGPAPVDLINQVTGHLKLF